jgi:molecular chaperone GrpE
VTVPGRNDENSPREAEEPHVVVRDRRKIDPETGDLRSPDTESHPMSGEGGASEAGHPPEPPSAAATASPEEADLRKQLDERTADLQRVQAEYANYRRRTGKEREQIAVAAKADIAGALLTVLDDVDRAQANGDLTGAFKSVADKLRETLQSAGLESFGHEGDEFDPSVHEAVQHDTSPEVAGPTVTAVLRHGYRFGDKVVRAAMVGVTDHEATAEQASGDGPEATPIADAAAAAVEPEPGESPAQG